MTLKYKSANVNSNSTRIKGINKLVDFKVKKRMKTF